MSKITYHKLVRDRIPQIITATGKTCTTELVSHDQYIELLGKNLLSIMGGWGKLPISD